MSCKNVTFEKKPEKYMFTFFSPFTSKRESVSIQLYSLQVSIRKTINVNVAIGFGYTCVRTENAIFLIASKARDP